MVGIDIPSSPKQYARFVRQQAIWMRDNWLNGNRRDVKERLKELPVAFALAAQADLMTAFLNAGQRAQVASYLVGTLEVEDVAEKVSDARARLPSNLTQVCIVDYQRMPNEVKHAFVSGPGKNITNELLYHVTSWNWKEEVVDKESLIVERWLEENIPELRGRRAMRAGQIPRFPVYIRMAW